MLPLRKNLRTQVKRLSIPAGKGAGGCAKTLFKSFILLPAFVYDEDLDWYLACCIDRWIIALNMRKLRTISMALGLFAALLATQARADSFIFAASGPPTSNGNDGPVDVTVKVTAVNGGFTFAISNLLSNPQGAGQILSALQLNLKQTLTGASLQTTGSWTQLVFGQTPFSSTVTNSGWALAGNIKGQNSTTTLAMCAGGCGTWKGNSIIGGSGIQSSYTAANSSITNGTHDSYLLGNGASPVVFVLNANGVTSNSKVGDYISSITFSFGTSGSTLLDSGPGTPAPTPEPASMLLMGSGVLALVTRYRRIRG